MNTVLIGSADSLTARAGAVEQVYDTRADAQ